ncbi:MAG: glycoside hydrolase [Mucilaginibacter sp.]|nr:glycoside hydrolase [Mucilaginibacter sp.]
MKRKFLTTTLLICCFLASFASITDFSGMWTGTLKTDTGEMYPLLYNFRVDGDKLTGTAKTPKGDLPIDDGKITGTDFKFTVTLGNMEIEHSGKFYGDSVGVDIAVNGTKAHSTLLRKK